eukprot:366354-Chlamydomonas_euryale.AAC.7
MAPIQDGWRHSCNPTTLEGTGAHLIMLAPGRRTSLEAAPTPHHPTPPVTANVRSCPHNASHHTTCHSQRQKLPPHRITPHHLSQPTSEAAPTPHHTTPPVTANVRSCPHNASHHTTCHSQRQKLPPHQPAGYPHT